MGLNKTRNSGGAVKKMSCTNGIGTILPPPPPPPNRNNRGGYNDEGYDNDGRYNNNFGFFQPPPSSDPCHYPDYGQFPNEAEIYPNSPRVQEEVENCTIDQAPRLSEEELGQNRFFNKLTLYINEHNNICDDTLLQQLTSLLRSDKYYDFSSYSFNEYEFTNKDSMRMKQAAVQIGQSTNDTELKMLCAILSNSVIKLNELVSHTGAVDDELAHDAVVATIPFGRIYGCLKLSPQIIFTLQKYSNYARSKVKCNT